jgi:hypothetical protein
VYTYADPGGGGQRGPAPPFLALQNNYLYIN